MEPQRPFAHDASRLVRRRLRVAEVQAEHAGQRQCADADIREPGLAVDLNPDFVIDFLKVVEPGIVHVEFRDSQNALVLRHEAGNDLYLVMPITSN